MIEKQTPLMQQYWSVKAEYPDEVVLFRMGDFFEMFHQDAETAAPILGIALTQRNKKDQDSPKMCGVPHHSIAGPIAKLLNAGFKVAICDQIEDPAVAKGLVKRAVTRVLTPGLVYDPTTLDELSNHFVMSWDETSVALADFSTGEGFEYQIQGIQDVERLFRVFKPVELVVAPSVAAVELSWLNRGTTLSHFPKSLNVGVELKLSAHQRLISYRQHLLGQEDSNSIPLKFVARSEANGLRWNDTTLAQLEIFQTQEGLREGSLFHAINRTVTSGGARLFKSRLREPLTDANEIASRHEAVAKWMKGSLKAFRQALTRLGDIERRLSKLQSSTFNPRDLLALADSIEVGSRLLAMHPEVNSLEGMEECQTWAITARNRMVDEPPLALKEGGIFRKGISNELDELIRLSEESQTLLLELEAREKAKTEIPSLKVRYNNVFGFYIEVTKTHVDKVPSAYQRKQTLTNAERYTTDELHALEEKILSSRSKRADLEYEFLMAIKDGALRLAPQLMSLAQIWARWDVESAIAWLAIERKYVRPDLVKDSGVFNLELCRHPVVEQFAQSSGFVPNSVKLEPGDAILLTGPNMAGKSTLMRQLALCVVMNQMGGYVPAERASMPIFDSLYTRIGARDALNEGLSTFMVEMVDAANILRNAGPRSLVVLDEIGRGTSTYDGLSLAQAILEELLRPNGPRVLFATHYHELSNLENSYSHLKNFHMSVVENKGQIRFLHTLKPGPALKSYGVHVAERAGLPKSVLSRAKELLAQHEAVERHLDARVIPIVPQAELPLMSWGQVAPSLTDLEERLIGKLRELPLEQMTPIDALNKLSEWQQEIS